LALIILGWQSTSVVASKSDFIGESRPGISILMSIKM
jgi:hypothetical protein